MARKSTIQIGDRFGKLTIIEKTDKQAICGDVNWKCQCDCGNTTHVKTGHLRTGAVISCGCYRKEISAIDNQKHISRIENTVLASHENNVLFKNNKTGVRGVSLTTNRKRQYYEAYIQFKKKRKRLGYFRTLEEAMEARKKAEEDIRDELKRLREIFDNQED